MTIQEHKLSSSSSTRHFRCHQYRLTPPPSLSSHHHQQHLADYDYYCCCCCCCCSSSSLFSNYKCSPNSHANGMPQRMHHYCTYYPTAVFFCNVMNKCAPRRRQFLTSQDWRIELLITCALYFFLGNRPRSISNYPCEDFGDPARVYYLDPLVVGAWSGLLAPRMEVVLGRTYANAASSEHDVGFPEKNGLRYTNDLRQDCSGCVRL